MGEIATAFFFDTYAFFEIMQGNKNYAPYKKCSIITTRLNLMELHYGLLRLYGKKNADTYYDRLLEFTVFFDDATVKKASLLKFFKKKKNLSYVDCIGYVLAQRMDVKFLTGDRQFADMENVEWVR